MSKTLKQLLNIFHQTSSASLKYEFQSLYLHSILSNLLNHASMIYWLTLTLLRLEALSRSRDISMFCIEMQAARNILCTLSLAIYVSHLSVLSFVQYRTISVAMTVLGK